MIWDLIVTDEAAAVERARLAYQTHVNLCRVCRSVRGILCPEGSRLHLVWIEGNA